MTDFGWLDNLFSNTTFPFRCEPFPSYPRTYDMVHAEGLLSHESDQQRRCSMLDIFIEIDRILRPEVTRSKPSFCSYSLIVLCILLLWYKH